MNDELKIKNNELGGKMNYRYRNDEEMKDSGVEWIGKIPKKWSRVRVGHLCEIGRGRVISSEEIMDNTGLYPVYSSQTKDNGVMGYINTYDFQGEYVTWTTDGANAGTVFKRNGKFNCTNVCGTLKNRSNELDLSFLAYALSIETKPYVRLDINPKLMNNEMSNIKVCITKNYEQRKIAKFLDEKTAQFDSIISKKEALIEKLEEAKKSLISEVVTGKVKVVKSSDGYELVERKKEEMKYSGVEWLGDIPMGWNVSKIKHISSINSNVLSENTDEEYEIKYIDIGSVTSDGRIIGLQEYKFKDAPSRARRIVNDKDILISTVRTYLKAITSIEKSDENLICSTGFAVLSPSENIDYKFLSYFIRGNKFIDEVVSRSVGVSYPAITSSEIANLEVIIPSLNEQVKIGNYIDNKINKLNSIISNTQNQIDKIKEAKQSLISDAVTGKIEILD